jgi:hypothetical protein
MEVDTPFYLKNGILSMSVSYHSDTSDYWVRMEAPIQKLSYVLEDVYIILYFRNTDVAIRGGEKGKPETEDGELRNMFHIGLPFGAGTADSLRHALGVHLERKDLLPASEYFREYEVENSSFIEGLKMVELDGLLGYIDTSRMVVIPFLYEYGNEFSDGLAAVKKDGSWGYIDRNGKTVIPFQFSGATDFVDGKAEVIWRNNRYTIDKKGRKKKLKRWWF